MRDKLFYPITIGFVALISVFIAFEQYWALAISAGLLVVLSLFLKLDSFFYLLYFLTPLSVNVENVGGGVGMTLPTEPLMFGLLLFLLAKMMFAKNRGEFEFGHPMTKLILFYLFWLLVTTITSSMMAVSLKFLLAKLWFVFGFYFLGVSVFKRAPLKNMKRTLWLYLVPLMGVIIYTLIRHTFFKYDEKAAHWVMQPFFKDHTIYGAILAILAPFVVYVSFKKHKNINTYIFIISLLITFIVGLVMSYTRAAWVSLAGAFVLYLILLLRVRWYVLLTTGMLCLGMIFNNWDQILLKLEKNKQDSSDDLVEHVQSISNIASDASNLERLNRWGSAWRMFLEKPILGWGPGTYSFQYAPFQHSSQLTIISTNFGDGGGAHSEYLGPLSETGLIGLLLVIAIIAYAYYISIRNYYIIKNVQLKRLLITVILGWSTYIAHGVLNNFLDTDKASVLFWGAIAFFVAVDIGLKNGTVESKAVLSVTKSDS